MADAKRGDALVNIESVIPGNITIRVGEKIYTIDGDVSARTAFTIQKMGMDIQTSMENSEIEKLITSVEALHDYMLPMFQKHDKALKELPWDAGTMQRVAGVIVIRGLGAGLDSMASMGDAINPPKPNRAARRSRSTSNGGSPPSSKSTVAP